ncbi:MAG: THUMP domain-containing protein, partial [Halobacteriaceae archaeon]
ERAKRVLETGPICDSCLGRAFATRSFGLSNADRGRALRVGVALDDDVPIDELTSEECWVCQGYCDQFDEWARRAEVAVEGLQFETYQVGTRTPPLLEENEKLLREEAEIDVDAGEPFKSEFNREVGKRLGKSLGKDVDLERPDVVILCELDEKEVSVQINPAFV